MGDTLVALFAIFCIFGLPLGGWIIVRALQYRERLEMIRRGMIPPPGWGSKDYREAYRVWAQGQQQAYRPGPQPWQAATPPPPPPGAPLAENDPQCQLNKGIKVAMIGLALTIALGSMAGTHGGPVLLGGLIPLFVGIAQIIIAVLGGARIPGVAPSYGAGPWQTGPMPPPPGAPPPPPPHPASAWERPAGARFEELTRPPSPPDFK